MESKNFERRLSKLEQSLSASNERITLLEKENKKLKSELEKLNKIINTLNGINTQMKQKMKQQDSQTYDLRNELSMLKSSLRNRG
jgi:peptidoglycan hydrolase CwlO-like protein